MINTEENSYFSLPFCRYSNGLKCIALLDFLVVTTLWLTGGDGAYFEGSIIRYAFMSSVFDVTIIAIVKTVVVFIILDRLEDVTMTLIDQPFDREKAQKQFYCHVFLLLTGLLPFCFLVIKGSFVLHSVIKGTAAMHLLYQVSLVCATAFGALELLLTFWSHRCMKRLQLLRIRQHVNESHLDIRRKRTANFKKFVILLKDEWPLLSVATVFTIGANVIAANALRYTGRVVDDAIASLDRLNRTILIVGALYFGHFTCSSIKSLCFHLASQKLAARWRTTAFRKLIKQELAFFDENRSGEFASRLSGDTAKVQGVVASGTIVQFFVDFATIAIVLWNMFAINVRVAGVFLAFSPLWIVTIGLFGKYQKKLWHNFQTRLAEAIATAEVFLGTMRLVKCMSKEKQSIHIYSHDIEESYLVGRKVAFLNGICTSLVYGVGYMTVIAVMTYGGRILNAGDISPGDLVSLIIFARHIDTDAINQFEHYGEIMEAYGASLRMIEILSMKVNECAKILSELSFTDISFHNVHYSNSKADKFILDGVSLVFRKMEVVVILGPSGGGKTTIANLMTKLFEPDIGRITIGSSDISSVDVRYLRSHVKLVDQDSMMTGGTFIDNITQGRSISTEEIEQACRYAQAHAFITSFQNGYNNIIGEKGMLLSAGERQRIAIARTLLTKPKILILDSATVSLDPLTEDIVLESVCQSVIEDDGIVIILSNNPRVVLRADRVIMVNEGKTREICEDELIQLKESARRSLDTWNMMLNR